jgi:hypothetical protein
VLHALSRVQAAYSLAHLSTTHARASIWTHAGTHAERQVPAPHVHASALWNDALEKQATENVSKHVLHAGSLVHAVNWALHVVDVHASQTGSLPASTGVVTPASTIETTPPSTIVFPDGAGRSSDLQARRSPLERATRTARRNGGPSRRAGVLRDPQAMASS